MLTNTVAKAGVQVLPVKFNVLNQLLVVIVGIAAPLVIDRLGAFVAEPPVVPNVNVLVMSDAAVNPPVPVQVKLVASAIDRLTAAAVVVANTILPEPKLIERVLVLVEANVPVVIVKPAKASVPAVNVVAAVAPTDSAPANVVVPLGQLIVNAAIGFPLLVIVPVPTIVAVSVV